MGHPESPTAEIVLEARGLTKHYGSTIALSGADLILGKGKVHALMGENGAGKSTLVKILVGATQPTGGELRLDGKLCAFPSVTAALAAGIVPIYQHLTLFPNLSVLENLFGFENAGPGLRAAHRGTAARQRAEQCLARIGLDIDPDRLVSSLNLSERQLLEIARGLHANCRVMLLDEPTATLNKPEVERLATVVQTLAADGVAIVYISHKTDEIRRLADQVTVLRDGKSVIAGTPLADTTLDALVDAMVGHAFAVTEKTLPPPGAPMVEIKDLRITRNDPPQAVTIRAGEIVGMIGLIGSGAEDFGAAAAGVIPCSTGEITIDGRTLTPGDRGQAVARGVGYVPPDRHTEGLFPGCSALANASASAFPLFASGAFLSGRRETTLFEAQFKRLALSPNEPARPIENFSGGNQQKVLFARNLGVPNLKFLVLNEPSRGVDIGARDTIHDAITQAARDGIAFLLITTDLEELTSLAHRTLIVRDRQVVKELPRYSVPDDVAKAMMADA
ncbi:MAG TPA: sugar ABC transporter ATP-binding protein [Rhodopila sp.]